MSISEALASVDLAVNTTTGEKVIKITIPDVGVITFAADEARRVATGILESLDRKQGH